MASVPSTRLASMPVEEFIRRSDQEGPFELIEGEIVPKMPSVAIHNKTAKRVFLALLPYEQQGLGEVFQEATFVLTDNPQWVYGSRIPDVMFVSRERLTQFESSVPDWQHKPYILVPELAVEIVSPTDRYSEINAKVIRYLNDGVRLIWVIDPQVRQVVVYRAGSDQQRTLIGDAVLTETQILPDFALPLSELFA
jgi:Uma2 family endonuclease